MSSMTNEFIKKKILFRSSHRGTKEMDLLLGNFVKKYINILNINELQDLDKILQIEDDNIQKWYFEKKYENIILKSKVAIMLKKFKPND